MKHTNMAHNSALYKFTIDIDIDLMSAHVNRPCMPQILQDSSPSGKTL